jgi:hypothetical protein
MRWPWRRGRRRRVDAPVPQAVDQWSAGWSDTFLPQPPLRTVERAPTSTVRLGFSDGTELELEESAVETSTLLAAARALIDPNPSAPG